jgi:hypothetical protein
LAFQQIKKTKKPNFFVFLGFKKKNQTNHGFLKWMLPALVSGYLTAAIAIEY